MSDKLKSIFKLDERRSVDGFCHGYEDGLDGYCIHGEGCLYEGMSWSGPNSNCLKPQPKYSYGGI